MCSGHYPMMTRSSHHPMTKAKHCSLFLDLSNLKVISNIQNYSQLFTITQLVIKTTEKLFVPIISLTTLRVRAYFHKTVRVCHVYCNFQIGFTCRITVIFGTLKDGSLLVNTLASNICFSYRNMFQNGVDALSKIVDAFLSKRSKFHLVRIIR